MTILICPSLFAIVMATLIFRRLWSVQSRNEEPEPEAPDFSFWDYQPMGRLLSREDWQPMAALSKNQAKEERRLRRERRRVFRTYLGYLRQDFRRLERASNRILLDSTEDRPDLARALSEQRWRFYWANVRLEFALLLHAMNAGSIEVRPLLEACRQLQAALAEANGWSAA